MRRGFAILVFLLGGLAASGAGEASPLVSPAHRLAADDPAWRDLAAGLRGLAAVTADFTENRYFPIKKTPTVLQGEARVSADRGLSLHYRGPPEQVVIMDDRGMVVREASGDTVPPADPRTAAANTALLHVMRLDLRPLEKDFELYGDRTSAAWRLALVPKDDALRRTLGQISIEGEGTAVRRIELRRSLTQRVEIVIALPRPTAAFTADELKRFFRTP